MKRSGLTKLSQRTRAAAAPRDEKRARARGTGKLAVLPARGERALPTTSIGVLVGIGTKGEVYIDLPFEQRSAVPARSIVPLDRSAFGREVLLAWPSGTSVPVVVGLLRGADDLSPKDARRPELKATLDGEQIDLNAAKEITLRCGKASIVLTADGKIVIKGAQLLSAASGLHRIRGGAVQIN